MARPRVTLVKYRWIGEHWKFRLYVEDREDVRERIIPGLSKEASLIEIQHAISALLMPDYDLENARYSSRW